MLIIFRWAHSGRNSERMDIMDEFLEYERGTPAALIKIICNRLKDEKVLLYDSNIVNKLRSMSRQELNQALAFGDVTEWHNERIREKSDEL